jgi:iron-sulfur cluster assembly protein
MDQIAKLEADQAQTEQPTRPAPPKPPAKGIQVTGKALARIRSAMAKENVSADQGGLRLGVQGGGCSGLSYNIRFDTQPRERDRVFQFEDVRVFVDPKSFIYLHGMTLDYNETLMQQGFVFVNPNSTKSCGCGSSFS